MRNSGCVRQTLLKRVKHAATITYKTGFATGIYSTHTLQKKLRSRTVSVSPNDSADERLHMYMELWRTDGVVHIGLPCKRAASHASPCAYNAPALVVVMVIIMRTRIRLTHRKVNLPHCGSPPKASKVPGGNAPPLV